METNIVEVAFEYGATKSLVIEVCPVKERYERKANHSQRSFEQIQIENPLVTSFILRDILIGK